MMQEGLPCVLFLALFIGMRALPACAQTAFTAGDRWVVLGDSITQTGAYHREIELFHLTRRPDRPIEVINRGLAGDTAEGALRRLDWDVLSARPTVVSVMFGMNDVGRHLYAPEKNGPEIEAARAARSAKFEVSMRELVRRLRAANARVILVQPSPFDETARLKQVTLPGCGSALSGYAGKVRSLAAELGVATVDFNGPMTDLNRRGQAADPGFTLVGRDRVHPGKTGHLVMACLFLQAQEETGLVSNLSIDAASGRVSESNGVTVTELVASPSSMAFTTSEAALPFPFDPEAAPALDLLPFAKTLNRQILRVTGLAKGRHSLFIDDECVAEFEAGALAAGVNLADLPHTPQLRQARAVRAALARKWEAEGKLRSVAYSEHFSWPDAPRPVDPAMMRSRVEARLAGIGSANSWVAAQHRLYLELKPREPELADLADAALAEARSLARPRTHRYALAPVIPPSPAP